MGISVQSSDRQIRRIILLPFLPCFALKLTTWSSVRPAFSDTLKCSSTSCADLTYAPSMAASVNDSGRFVLLDLSTISQGDSYDNWNLK